MVRTVRAALARRWPKSVLGTNCSKTCLETAVCPQNAGKGVHLGEGGAPGGVEVGERAGAGDQLRWRAILDHLALGEHQHPVGDQHGGQPVRDDQCGAPASTVASAACTARSEGMSSEEVASSSTSTAGSASSARAKDTSCRWPADSRPPRLRTSVS